MVRASLGLLFLVFFSLFLSGCPREDEPDASRYYGLLHRDGITMSDGQGEYLVLDLSAAELSADGTRVDVGGGIVFNEPCELGRLLVVRERDGRHDDESDSYHALLLLPGQTPERIPLSGTPSEVSVSSDCRFVLVEQELDGLFESSSLTLIDREGETVDLNLLGEDGIGTVESAALQPPIEVDGESTTLVVVGGEGGKFLFFDAAHPDSEPAVFQATLPGAEEFAARVLGPTFGLGVTSPALFAIGDSAEGMVRQHVELHRAEGALTAEPLGEPVAIGTLWEAISGGTLPPEDLFLPFWDEANGELGESIAAVAPGVLHPERSFAVFSTDTGVALLPASSSWEPLEEPAIVVPLASGPPRGLAYLVESEKTLVLIHSSKSITLLDLNDVQDPEQVLLPATRGLPHVIVDEARSGFWVYVQGRHEVAFVTAPGGTARELSLDQPVDELHLLPEHDRLVALHDVGVGYLTVIEADDPRRESAQALAGYHLTTLLEEGDKR